MPPITTVDCSTPQKEIENTLLQLCNRKIAMQEIESAKLRLQRLLELEGRKESIIH